MTHKLIKSVMFSKNIFGIIDGVSSLEFKTNDYPNKSSINIASQTNEAGNLLMWIDREFEIIDSKEICEVFNKHLEYAKKELFDIFEKKREEMISK